MPDQEGPEEEQAPRRPRVVDKRISARHRSHEAEPSESRSGPAAAGEAAAPPPADPPPTSPAGIPNESKPASAGTQDETHEQEAARVWTPEQEAEAQRMAEEIARTPSLDWVVQSAITLANVAGTKLQLGAVADAQLAIDVFAGIVDAAGARLQDAEAPLRQTLAQLQMMYAERIAPPPRA